MDDEKFEGCVCFAIPPKMFRKLLEKGEGTHAQRHLKHSGQLRSLRYEAHQQAPAAGKRARAKLRRSVYDVAGGDTLPGRLVRTEDGKRARDAAANQAFDNAGVALAFWREVFGRNSVDGKGMPVVSTVHYGTGFQNAMWTGQQMVYGDGDDAIGGFTEALDIIAHELSHGVTQHLIPGGLGVARIPVKEREFKEQKYTLKGQAGALNESFSDVFASMVKQWHGKQTVDQADWLIGENVLAPMLGRAIRSLKSPGNRKVTWSSDDQIKSFADWHEDCDAHDASGIANHAFYSVATKLGGHSWEKTGPIWFDAYGQLGAKATFEEAAHATLDAAGERFGAGSAEAKAVKAAWRKVKVL
jgi:Zn-dependent metalloprotease